MRFRPSVDVTCHVCGSTFTVRTRLELPPRRRSIRSEPSACPTCDAPIKTIPAIALGIAKGLVLIAMGAPSEKKEYGTTRKFLTRYTRTERDVDELMSIARSIDYDEWVELNTSLLRPGERAPELRAELKLIPSLRKAAEGGALFALLQKSADQVKKAYRTERARRMAIVEQRRGQ